MRHLLPIIALFLPLTTTFGLDLDKANMVPNREPGYCVWACLETVGKQRKIEPLYNLVEKRTKDGDELILRGSTWEVMPKNLGNALVAKRKLDSLKVPCWTQSEGNFSHNLVKLSKSYGCVVGIHAGGLSKEHHAVLLIDFNDEKVRFYDPNKPGKTFTATRSWFDYWWSGLAILVTRPK